MIIMILPGLGPTVEELIDALDSITFIDIITLILSFILGWLTAYIILINISNTKFGIYTISFIIGNFIGILYFMICGLVINPLIYKLKKEKFNG